MICLCVIISWGSLMNNSTISNVDYLDHVLPRIFIRIGFFSTNKNVLRVSHFNGVPLPWMSNVHRTLANISRISAHARFLPIHDLGPTLNGITTALWSAEKGDPGLSASGSQRSGINDTGWWNRFGSRNCDQVCKVTLVCATKLAADYKWSNHDQCFWGISYTTGHPSPTYPITAWWNES